MVRKKDLISFEYNFGFFNFFLKVGFPHRQGFFPLHKAKKEKFTENKEEKTWFLWVIIHQEGRGF